MIEPEDAGFDVVSVLSGKMKEAFESLSAELRNCSEFELCEKVDPGPSDYKMRQNFSNAVEVARTKNKPVRVTSIFEDVVSRQTFFEWYANNPLKVAFICRPVVPHHSYYDAIWKEGLRKMFMYVRKYDLDPKHMGQFMRIVEKAGDRTIGPVVQRVHQHNTHQPQLESRDIEVDANDPKAMQSRIDEMQAKMTAMTNKQLAEKVIEIEPED